MRVVVSRRFHWRRTGRRNAFLAGLSTMWLVYGWSLINGPFLAGSPMRLWRYMGPFGDLLSTPWWATVWIVAGVVGFAVAARGVSDRLRHRGSSMHRDALGFNAVLIPPMLWVLLHAWSWVIAIFDIDEGNPRGWVSAAVWGISVLSIMIVAGWPEVDPPHDHDEGDEPE